MRLVLSVMLLCAVTNVGAESLVTDGYREAVFSVSSIDKYRNFFESVAGWEAIAIGEVSAGQLAAWHLPTKSSATQILLANPGTTRGFVRLVQFADVPQVQIRSNAQSWDTGGWFDVNSRIVSMERKFADYQARGWQSTSDPVEFSFGPFVVKEWLARGPDGIVIALIERVQPPLEGWPLMKEMSRFFNATQIVPDIELARAFYIDKLGFEAYLNHDAASAAPGPNVLGIPHNFATEIARNVSIVHPTGLNEGSIEILEFDGFEGADWSERAVPPNLGILMLRFPVANIDAFHAHVESEEIEVVMQPITLSIVPYGDVRLMAIRGPGGAWLEFFEVQNDN